MYETCWAVYGPCGHMVINLCGYLPGSYKVLYTNIDLSVQLLKISICIKILFFIVSVWVYYEFRSPYTSLVMDAYTPIHLLGLSVHEGIVVWSAPSEQECKYLNLLYCNVPLFFSCTHWFITIYGSIFWLC